MFASNAADSRRQYVAAGIAFILAAFLFTALSVFATDIGTNVTVTGHLFATSTAQATRRVIAYQNMQVGTTSPANIADIGFAVGTSTYFANFVGIGDATGLGSGMLKVQNDVFATGTIQATNNMIAYRHLLVGTTTPANLDAIGAQFATSTYFSKFVGIGDATFFGNDNLKVQGDVYATGTVSTTGNIFTAGSLLIGATTTATEDLTIAGDIFMTGGLGVNNATTSAGGVQADHADFNQLQVGTGSTFNEMRWGTCSVNPPMLKPGNATTTTCTATGVATTDYAFMTAPGLPWSNSTDASTGNIVFVAASTTAADTITVQVGNTSTSTALDAAAATWVWMTIR